MSLKYNLKQSTRANYLYLYDRFVRRTIGKRLLKDIRYSDVKYYYYQLINKEGLKPITVDNIQTLIHPVFAMGVRDGVIRQNPASGVMTEIKKSNLWDKGTGVRHALTVDQGKAFLDYVRQSKTYNHWLPLFLCFFCTGMRVGEVCGLTWNDVDFEKREISVNHALIYRKIDDSMKYYISRPKSEAGIRVVPIMNQLYTELEALYQLQKMRGFNATSLDGLTKFIFVTQRGGFYQQGTINKAISRILNEYNDQERLKAAREGRKPLLLPHFSCHHIRHTFCTRLCENEQNIKAIQEIMGHKDIKTTLNIYAEATNTVKHEAIESLQKGWSIF
jgi:integrase